MNRVFNNQVLAVVETFQQVTHKVLPCLKGGGGYRKSEVALSRIFRKLQEGREARGKEGGERQGRDRGGLSSQLGAAGSY